MAADRDRETQPGRHGRWLAALALLAVVGVALLPRAFAGDTRDSSASPAPDFLQRYNPEAGLAAICREPEILGEAHGLCGLGGMRQASYPVPGTPRTKDIRFATEEPEPSFIDAPALDEFELGFSQMPAVRLADAAGALSGFGGGFSIAAGGTPAGALLLLDDGGSNTNNFPPPEDGCDPQTEDCDGDSDSEPPENPIPEPSAALLFGLGFAAILRRRPARSR